MHIFTDIIYKEKAAEMYFNYFILFMLLTQFTQTVVITSLHVFIFYFTTCMLRLMYLLCVTVNSVRARPKKLISGDCYTISPLISSDLSLIST